MNDNHSTNEHAAAPDVNTASWAAKFFLLRPTFGVLLFILLTLGGIMSYFVLTKESLPDLEIPQATIMTFWSGTDPQTIEQEVTDKIEKEIKTINSVKKVTSASFDSYSIIAVEFDASSHLAESMQLLRSKVDDAAGQLPDAADAPTINQISVDDRPIMTIVLYGDVGDRAISRAAQDLEDRLERISGVNEVEIGGMRKEIVQIQLNPRRILALGIAPTEVRDAIRGANMDMPWGEIESEEFGATVRLAGRFRDIDDLRQLPIARPGQGRIVRLGEIADVHRDLEDETSRALFSWLGEPFAGGVEVSVKKTPGFDTVTVLDNVLVALEEAQGEQGWPQGLHYRVTQNESEQIWDSLKGVLNNAWQAMLAVFVILFVLLTWREGLIAGLAVPVSFLGALIVIWLIGYSLNELVIIGMVLALGLLVDVFILMMEGLHEGIFVQHLTFGQAAVATVRRYGIPAAAGQATTILALAPLMAISGVAGKFIRVLPATTIICLSMAFVVALLIAVPMSRYLLSHVTSKQNRTTPVDRITAGMSERLKQWSLRATLRNRYIASLWVVAALVIFVLSFVAFTNVPMVMYAKSDGLKLGITIELPTSTTLDTSQRVADRIGAILREKDYFESVVQLVGKKSPMASSSLGDALRPSVAENFVGFSCMFLPREQREAPGYEIADRLREELDRVLNTHYAGATLLLVPETGQPSSEAPVEIRLMGDDMDQLRAISRQVQTALRQVRGAVEVRDNLGSVRTEINLTPRREAIDFYNISQQELASQVRLAMSNDEIGKYAIGGMEDDLSIRLSLAWPSRNGRAGGPTRVDELAMVRAFTTDGETVPLLSLLAPSISTAPTAIVHEDGRRSISVQAKTDGRPPAEILAELQPQLDEMQDGWPGNYSYAVGGEAEEVAETFGSAGIMLVVAIVLVFGLLVLMFGSFSQSLIVIATMPLALIGTFIGFWLIQIPFSFFAMVGLISLIGIVVNNAIVMVDTMNNHLRGGIDVATAAARGASDRLRPIVSTSLTTIVGLIPLAVTNPMWRPLCYAIIFGLIASTVTSMIIVPCLYLLFTRKTMVGEPDLN
jgi:multidrug efflux pump subunit AcrB